MARLDFRRTGIISQNSGKKHCTKGQFPYSLCQHIIPSNGCEMEEVGKIPTEIKVAPVIRREVAISNKKTDIKRYLIYISTVP